MVLGWSDMLLMHGDCGVDDLGGNSLLVDDRLDNLVDWNCVRIQMAKTGGGLAYHDGGYVHQRLAQPRRIVKLAESCWYFGRHPVHDQLLLGPRQGCFVETNALLVVRPDGCAALVVSLRESLVGRLSVNVRAVTGECCGCLTW